MSAKLDGLRVKLNAFKGNDPIIAHFKRGTELLLPPYYTGDNPNTTDPAERILPPATLKSQATMETGEEVERLRAIKEFANAYKEAVSEYLKEVEVELYQLMTNVGPLAFETNSGQKFNRTHTNLCKPRDQENKWADPAIKQLLIDMGKPTIAAGSINATSGKSAITKWLEENPIEVLVPNEDQTAEVPLEGDALIKALGLEPYMTNVTAEDGTVTGQREVTVQEQLEWRRSVHARVHEHLEVDREPAIQMRKA